MPLDPAAADVLQLIEGAGTPPLEEMTVADARAAYAGLVELSGPGADVTSAEMLDIGGVPSLVVSPIGEGPFPILVWIHGGGWVIGSAEESAPTAKDLSAGAGCVVVSLDYRLAPEHPAPAAFEDCLMATQWLLDHGDELGGDPERIAVGGDSAGGNLAALVALELGQRLRYQVLVYPGTDLSASSPSIDENGDGYLLTKSSIEWFVGHYLGETGVDPADPSVSPLHASDSALAGAPPAFVITAEFDPLRDEGEAYADRLSAAGVVVAHRRFDGQIHGFYGMPAAIPAGAEAIRETAEHLRLAFS